MAGIQNRLQTQQQRLDAGAGTPKELVRLQEEIQQMRKRISDLEEQMLSVLGEMEQLEDIEQQIAQRKQEHAQEMSRLKEEVGTENSQITVQLQQLENVASSLRAGAHPNWWGGCRKGS